MSFSGLLDYCLDTLTLTVTEIRAWWIYGLWGFMGIYFHVVHL